MYIFFTRSLFITCKYCSENRTRYLFVLSHQLTMVVLLIVSIPVSTSDVDEWIEMLTPGAFLSPWRGK